MEPGHTSRHPDRSVPGGKSTEPACHGCHHLSELADALIALEEAHEYLLEFVETCDFPGTPGAEIIESPSKMTGCTRAHQASGASPAFDNVDDIRGGSDLHAMFLRVPAARDRGGQLTANGGPGWHTWGNELINDAA